MQKLNLFNLIRAVNTAPFQKNFKIIELFIASLVPTLTNKMDP